MSNVKISQLPAASTFSPAADVAPIVHSGVTQKATLNQIVQAVLPSPGAIGSVTPSTAQFSALTLTTASGMQKAVAGLFTNAVAGVDYLPATTGSAIQKANGVGGLTNAVSGSDYAPPTVGTSILYGNGSGGFSNVTVGSGLTFAAGTLASTAAGGTVTSVSVVTANGLAGTVATSTTTPAITLSTTVTGLLKGNGTAISAAVSGTDYAPATTGTSILKGNGSGGFSSATAGTDYAAATTGTNAQLLANNGSGGFSNVTVGSGLTYSAGTLAAVTGSGGTVTDVSVVSANGFAGTVATSTTTPAITLSTSVTGLLKGNGTAVSAAVSGTDYAPATSGNSILYGNGAGGFSNVSIGSNMTFSSGVLNANATTSIVGSPGYYGSFYDTNATQVAANTTTAYPIKINSTFEANGVSIANDGSGNPTRVTFANAGVYNLQYSIQFTNTDSSIHNVNVWLRKNDSGVTGDVADSNSQYAVVGSHGGIHGQLIAAVNFVFTAAANDFFEIMWQPESTQVYIETIPAGTTPTTPVAPGIIVTACQQAQIGVGYYGLTSSTSTLIGTGSKTFTTNLDATATAFTVGTRVRLAYSVTPANFMEGVITAFSGTTLVVNVDNTGGSGTYASWTVSVAGNFSATSGTSILYGNGSGGFSNVTIGSGLSFSTGTLSATGGGTGTVTSVSGTGTVNGLTLTGTVTTSGSLTLGGTLDLSTPPAIGGTTPNTGKFTNLEYTGTFTGSTGVLNIGLGQLYKDASGNVGIGTSSPTGISGYTALTLGGSSSKGLLTFRSSSASDSGYLYHTGSSIELAALSTTPLNLTTSNANLTLGTVGTTRATLDQSGNLGLGVTPSAWLSSYKAFQVGNAAVSSDAVDKAQLSANFYRSSSNDIFISNGYATLYQQSAGAHKWFASTASGTAGNAITFTQAMTLDASGNLLVGLTSPVSSSRLRINSANTTDSTICGTFQNGNNSELFSVYDAGAIRAQYIGTTTGTGLILDASGYIKKSSSSRRYKTNEKPIDIGLDFVLSLNPITYDLIDGNIPQVGFIAEDFPDSRFVSRSMVDPSDESKGYQVEGVDYAHIVAPLVKAIQELSKEIETLKAKVK